MTSAPNRYLTVAICFACLASVLPAEDKTPVKVKRDLVFAEVAGQKLKLDLHIPSTEEKPPVVVWIHGGGWRGGSRSVQRLSGITEHGFAIAAISYRFTDKAIFPAQIHDCKAAVRWLRKRGPLWIRCRLDRRRRQFSRRPSGVAARHVGWNRRTGKRGRRQP